MYYAPLIIWLFYVPISALSRESRILRVLLYLDLRYWFILFHYHKSNICNVCCFYSDHNLNHRNPAFAQFIGVYRQSRWMSTKSVAFRSACQIYYINFYDLLQPLLWWKSRCSFTLIAVDVNAYESAVQSLPPISNNVFKIHLV